MTVIFIYYFKAPRENLVGDVVLLKVRLSEPKFLLAAAAAAVSPP